jgi:hypothetical protein
MLHNLFNSPVSMALGFPVLFLVLLALVHGVIEFAPHYIRKHRVSYRPIRTVVADSLLILRLALSRQ